MSDEDVMLNIKGLDQILKALKAPPPLARVGILGSKALRHAKKDGPVTQTNASIGAAHEFGTSKLPMRSFLRVPISDNLEKEMETSGLLDEKAAEEVIKQGSVLPWLQKVAIQAEAIVLGAFDTGGYGKWAPWKNPNHKSNANMILVDTQQLRNSITSEVK